MKNTHYFLIILVISLICVSSGLINGKPEGYVGGTINTDGDMVGGHPSEEQMIRDRAVAGVSVVINEHGNHIFSGENWREFAAMDKITKKRIPADNPYDPEIQPGRYSNYILTHPDPTNVGNWAEYTPTRAELTNQSSNIGFLKIIVIAPDGTVRKIYSINDGLPYPDDNGGPNFQHTTAWNKAHKISTPYLTVTVGGVPVPVTWQTKDGVAYTTDVIEGTPNGAIINGLPCGSVHLGDGI